MGTPSSWGGQNTSKDYEFMMEGRSKTAKPISLVGHALTSPSQDLSDPVTVSVVEKIGGQIKNFTRTIRPAQQLGLTFTMLFGSGLWTPALERARRGGECTTRFYAKRLCPANSDYEHAYIYPDAILNPPVRANDFITIEDTTLAEWQTEMRVERELILWNIAGYLKADLTPNLYAVAFRTEDCLTCGGLDLYQSIVATGGVGGVADDLIVIVSDDRGSSQTTLTTPAPDGNIGVCIFTLGDVILIGFRDDPDVAVAATGGTIFSNDGETFTLDSNVTECVNGVGFLNGVYIAVGGAGGGQAMLWSSENGIAWTSITSSNLPATSALTGLAVDEVANAAFAVGEDGEVLRIVPSGDSFAVETVAALPGTPGNLVSVNVFAEDYIGIGGDAGYYAESDDGGASWSEVAVPGSDAVWAVAGTENQAMIGSGTAFYNRSILTENEFSAKALASGVTITGDVRGIAKAPEEFNWFVAVTDDGEIVFWNPRYPNA